MKTNINPHALVNMTGFQHDIQFSDVKNDEDLKDSIIEIIEIAKDEYNIGVYFYREDEYGLIGKYSDLLNYINDQFGFSIDNLDQLKDKYPMVYPFQYQIISNN